MCEAVSDAYSAFAGVYDSLMDNVPYESWASYLDKMLSRYGASGGLVLDLGCGTGRMTRLLSEKGYDMIGVDSSEDMLSEAAAVPDEGILYLQQDMREFELYGTVRGVVSVCDCLNYITEPEELGKVFSLVNNYLDPGGVFIFDINTVYKYKSLGQRTIAETRDDCAFIWENAFSEEDMINEYDLTLFIQEDGEIFRRCEEIHCQRAYEKGEVLDLLKRAGLKVEAVYDAYTENEPRADSLRLTFIARENGKTQSISHKNQ